MIYIFTENLKYFLKIFDINAAPVKVLGYNI